jgi:hypothetical protein
MRYLKPGEGLRVGLDAREGAGRRLRDANPVTIERRAAS